MKKTWINLPKFRKMSFSDFWYHYKFHTVFGVFALIIIISFIFSMSDKTEYDLYVHFVGLPAVQQEEAEEPLCNALQPALKDISGDNKVVLGTVIKNVAPYSKSEDESAFMTVVEMTQTTQPTDADLSVIEKITLDLTAGEPSLYVINGDILKVYSDTGIFDALDDLNLNNSTDVIRGESETDPGKEHIFAVSIEGNALLESCNIDTTGKYLAIRTLSYGQEKEAEYVGMHENAISALQYILKHQ